MSGCFGRWRGTRRSGRSSLRVVCGHSLPRLLRLPFRGSPERKSSGIPSTVVWDHGASVSTGFPTPDAGRGPAAPAKSARSRTPPAQVHRPLKERGEESKRGRRRSGRCESSRVAKTCLLRRFASTVLSLTSARLRNSPHQKAPPRWGSDSPRRLAPIATPAQWVPARICSASTVPRLRDSRRRSWPPGHFQVPHRPRGEEKGIAWRWKLLGAGPTAQRERCPTAL